MGQDITTGYFHRRRAESSFRLERSCPQSQAALGWLNYVSASEHIFIQHACKSARGKKKKEEKKKNRRKENTREWISGPFKHSLSWAFFYFNFMRARVFLTASQTTLKSKNWPSKQSVPSKSMHTSNSWVNYNLVVMKECQWRQLKQENARVQSFFQNAPSLHPGPLTTSDILELVQTGELLGILRVEVETPEHFKGREGEKNKKNNNNKIALFGSCHFFRMNGVSSLS